MQAQSRVGTQVLGGDACRQRFAVQINEVDFAKAGQQLRQVQIVAVARTQDAQTQSRQPAVDRGSVLGTASEQQLRHALTVLGVQFPTAACHPIAAPLFVLDSIHGVKAEVRRSGYYAVDSTATGPCWRCGQSVLPTCVDARILRPRTRQLPGTRGRRLAPEGYSKQGGLRC